MSFSLLYSLVNPVANIFKAREKRKANRELASAKLAQARLNGEQQVTLEHAEWETVTANNLQHTWKDEYVTLVVTSPIPGILMGGVYFAFTGDDRLLMGIASALNALQKLGVDIGNLMHTVVLAAIGLKFLGR